MTTHDATAGLDLIAKMTHARESGANETIVRQYLVACLQDMYPAAVRPWWIDRHILGAESAVRTIEAGQSRRGAVDSVVGLTAIEYEPDLRGSRRAGGYSQVRQYCAGLINQGADPDKVRGVLSDGVDWYAYRVSALAGLAPFGQEDIELDELEHLSLVPGDEKSVKDLARFLDAYLGRPEVRPLSGISIATYFGLTSPFGLQRLTELLDVLNTASQHDPARAEMVSDLWRRLAGYLDADADQIEFNELAYLQELYLSILAKLICLNVIEQRAVGSPAHEIDEVLNGARFEDAGLRRFVEHDYFGWIHEGYEDEIRPIALAIQADLTAFDFTGDLGEDLFGSMMAELAEQSHRLLLGQEFTPAWLARRMSEQLFASLPVATDPHFIDMCCGSGSMLVEVAKCAQAMLEAAGVERGTSDAVRFLARAAVGFDIDPLAVILAKVNWVATNRDWIERFDGSNPVSVPVYHADSLFGITPLGRSASDTSGAIRLRLLDDIYIDLPPFLLDPSHQESFDQLIDDSYDLAKGMAQGVTANAVDEQTVAVIVERSLGINTGDEYERVVHFIAELVTELSSLQRQGRNGIWTFILRNTYRPELVAGQFNGLISNPPWLALSRIGNNPLKAALNEMAAKYQLVPAGSSFLHLELATTFLSHSIERYLTPGALVTCVLPAALLDGSHHQPLRCQLDGTNETAEMQLRLTDVWILDKCVFKNRALVVCGSRDDPVAWETLPALQLSEDGQERTDLFAVNAVGRHIWRTSNRGLAIADNYGANFSQGSDVMPRTLFIVQPGLERSGKTVIGPIDRIGPSGFLITDAKKCKTFLPKTRTVASDLVHKVLTSKLLIPYFVAAPATILAPVRQGTDGEWLRASRASLSGDRSAMHHFSDVIGANPEWSSLDDIWDKSLNLRNKLTKQRFGDRTWAVFYGAGGGTPAAAHVPSRALKDTIIDQTLYWSEVETAWEAWYLVGLFNSPAMLDSLSGLLPEGNFGDRHIHTVLAKATPRFDPDDADHTTVVQTTRRLRREIVSAATTDPKISRLLTTKLSMTARRNQLRKAIQEMGSFRDYEDACAKVLS